MKTLVENAKILARCYARTERKEMSAFMVGFLAGHAFATDPAPALAVIEEELKTNATEAHDVPEDIGG